MRIRTFMAVTSVIVGCDENKYDKLKVPKEAQAEWVIPSQLSSSTPPPAKPTPKAVDCESAIQGGRVRFADRLIEAEVRRKLAKPGGDISVSDLKSVRSLNLTLGGGKLSSLDPCVFSKFENLKELFLPEGEYEDLSPLNNLTQLETLRASGGRITDLRPIEKLTRLDRLDLANNPLTETKSLAYFVNLTELLLDGTQVKDLTPLSGMKKLETLSIRKTPVTDLSPLKDLKKMKTLYLAESSVKDTSVLAPLTPTGLKIHLN